MPEQVVPVRAVRGLEVRLCANRIKCSYPHRDQPCKALNSTNNDTAAFQTAAVTGQYSIRIRVLVSIQKLEERSHQGGQLLNARETGLKMPEAC